MSFLLTPDAARRRALQVTEDRRPEEGPWRVVSVRFRPVMFEVPAPFNPEDTYLNVNGIVRDLRGPMPPAWYVELNGPAQRSRNEYYVLLGIFDGRVLASVPGLSY